MNKSRLRESIQNGYQLFKELLAEFDAEQMQRPGAVGKWSLKDTVVHIVVHEQRMLQWMNERLSGKHPIMFQPYAMPDDKLDQLNEEIYFENRNRPLDDILHALEETHAETLKLVETSLEKDLFDTGRFQFLGGEPLWEAVAANTFEHYEEHSRGIQTSPRLWLFGGR